MKKLMVGMLLVCLLPFSIFSAKVDRDGCPIYMTKCMLAAIMNNSEKAFADALDQGANVRMIVGTENGFLSATAFALLHKRFQFARMLVDRLPNINEIFRDGYTVLTASTLLADTSLWFKN